MSLFGISRKLQLKVFNNCEPPASPSQWQRKESTVIEGKGSVEGHEVSVISKERYRNKATRELDREKTEVNLPNWTESS